MWLAPIGSTVMYKSQLTLLFILVMLSGCSWLTTNEQNTYKGNSYASTTNSLSGIYCYPSTYADEYDSMSDNEKIVNILLSPLLFTLVATGLTIDTGISLITDTIALPYTLVTTPDKPRSDITDCSEGVWHQHFPS